MLAVSAGTAREPDREGIGGEDSRVDAAAISFPEDLQQGMRDCQSELRTTGNALGENLREGQRRRAAMEHVIADAAARHESFGEAISPELHDDRDSSSEGLDDAQRHQEGVQDALHDAVVLAETEVVDWYDEGSWV